MWCRYSNALIVKVIRVCERYQWSRQNYETRMHACHLVHTGKTDILDCHYNSNTVVLKYAALLTPDYVFSSVQSLVHHDLCSGSPPHMEVVHRVAAVAGPGCGGAASMPQSQTLLEKNSSLVLQL